MDDDQYSQLTKIIATRLLHSPWNSFGLTETLQKLVDTRRPLKWMSQITEALLAAFKVCPSKLELESWLAASEQLRKAATRSVRLKSVATHNPNVSRGVSAASVAKVLAGQLCNNAWSHDAIAAQLRAIGDSELAIIDDVARHVVTGFGDRRPAAHRLWRFLQHSKPFRDMLNKVPRFYHLQIAHIAPAMQPVPGRPSSWRVPAIHTPAELAAWLSLPPKQMWWLVDGRWGGSRHYQRRWSKKRSGGWRLLEAPRAILKQAQRDIAGGILHQIPPHDAAHGFCRGRNIKSFLATHVGQRFAIRMDLRNFFASVQRSQVAAIFRTAGYPDAVSSLLGRLTTTLTPPDELARFSSSESRQFEPFRSHHLPQGAPTSPALANLAAYRLDCRLHGVAKQFGANYTRYADDLVFSGDEELRKSARRFHTFVLSIVLEEGFCIHPRKTRMMPSSARQRAAGLVFNNTPNTSRQDYDNLKAVLHNCARYGPHSQNRDAVPNFAQHLLGRVQFHAHINPRRGEKLMRMYCVAFR